MGCVVGGGALNALVLDEGPMEVWKCHLKNLEMIQGGRAVRSWVDVCHLLKFQIFWLKKFS